MMRRPIVALAAIAAWTGTAAAQTVPESVTFSARIADGGEPLTGSHDFDFALYDMASGGTAIWQETGVTLTVNDGLVYHELGALSPLDDGVLSGRKLYLGLTVDGTTLSPRVPIVSVPYAVRAGVADSLAGVPADEFITGVLAGNGLSGGGSTGDVTLSVAFAGSGTATTVSRSDHDHDGDYLPLGATLTCNTGDVVTGVSPTTGDLVCSTPSTLGDGTADTIADDGVISDSEVSDAITISSSGTVAWSALSSYPTGCGAGEAVTSVGDALGCSTFDGTGDTIADDGVISDGEAADALSINSGSLYASNAPGNVGIGTSSPTGSLHIARLSNVTETCGGANLVANAAAVKFRDDIGGGCGDTAWVALTDLDGAGAGEATRLEIGVANDADDDVAFRTSAGRVHFGNLAANLGVINVGPTGSRAGAAGFDPPTTTNGQGVWLEGGDGEAGGFYADGDVAVIYSPGDPDLLRVYDEDGMVLKFYVDGSGNARVGASSTIGCVQDGDGTAIAGSCISDRRLKKDIRPFAPMLDRVVKLQPVTYRWRADEFPVRRLGTGETYGLIAQDVEQLFPEMVTRDPEGMLTVDYSRLPLLLLAAVKEERARVHELEGEVDALRDRMEALERRLGASASAPPPSAPATPAAAAATSPITASLPWGIAGLAGLVLVTQLVRRGRRTRSENDRCAP